VLAVRDASKLGFASWCATKDEEEATVRAMPLVVTGIAADGIGRKWEVRQRQDPVL